MKVLSICFTAKVNQIATSSKIPKMSRSFNFTSDVSVHAIVTCQGVFVPVPAFDDYFILLVQHIVLSINSDLQLSLKQSSHRFVLTLYCWYRPKISHTKTGSSFEASIFQSSFNSCESLFCFLWLKDFLWFKYLVSYFVSDMW